MDIFDDCTLDKLIHLSTVISNHVSELRDMAQLSRREPSKKSPDYSAQLQQEVNLITKASAQLQSLISEPNRWVAHSAWSYLDSVAISLCLEMGLHKLIEPGDKTTTLDHLVQCTGASPALISKRISCCNADQIFIFQNESCGSVSIDRYLKRLRLRRISITVTRSACVTKTSAA